jgi:hypothetical protein
MDCEEKIDAKLDEYKGTVTLNLLEFIKKLPDDVKKELVTDGGWWPFIEDQLAYDIIESYGSEHYNEVYHRLREKLINNKAMPEIIQEWGKQMVTLREQSNHAENYWRDAYWKLYAWITDAVEWENRRGMPILPSLSYIDMKIPPELIEEVRKFANEIGILFPEND